MEIVVEIRVKIIPRSRDRDAEEFALTRTRGTQDNPAYWAQTVGSVVNATGAALMSRVIDAHPVSPDYLADQLKTPEVER